MAYFTEYETNLIGTLTLASDGEAIIGCWFDNDRYFGIGVDGTVERRDDLPIFAQTRKWLDRYFAGEAPDPRELPLAARATEFQMRVREAMLDIPYGQTTTYGAIAKRIERETGKRQSARAVGGAVGHNPLCLIVPCHRVVGSNGSLTGFGGGIDMKVKLLEHEHAMKDSFSRPKKGTALVGVESASLKYLNGQSQLSIRETATIAELSRKRLMTRYFEYGDDAVEYLKARDAKLAKAIDAVGHVYREMGEESLFAGVVHCIVGQQISSAAHATVWARLKRNLGEVTPATVNAANIDELQGCGMTFKKAGYIKDFAAKVESGEFDIDAVEHMSDTEAIAALSSLSGIGIWTAEMLLLFTLGRPDILSFGDLAIHRGMRMVYHHRKVTREMFERYRRRYSPYGSVASLYLWAISHMDVPGYDHDYAPMTEAQKKASRKKRAKEKR